MNHHFRLNNSHFNTLEHPRWGAILGVFATKPIKSGEEIFAYYGYGENAYEKNEYGAVYDIPYDHPWYWELKRQTHKEERSRGVRSKDKNVKQPKR